MALRAATVLDLQRLGGMGSQGRTCPDQRRSQSLQLPRRARALRRPPPREAKRPAARQLGAHYGGRRSRSGCGKGLVGLDVAGEARTCCGTRARSCQQHQNRHVHRGGLEVQGLPERCGGIAPPFQRVLKMDPKWRNSISGPAPLGCTAQQLRSTAAAHQHRELFEVPLSRGF